METIEIRSPLTWSEIDGRQQRITDIRNLAAGNNFYITDPVVAYTGGRLWEAHRSDFTPKDVKHKTQNRPFAVVLAREGADPAHPAYKILRIPTEKESDFAQTQVSWSRDYARFVAEKLYQGDIGKSPIPVATKTFDGPDNIGLVTVTDYIRGLRGLGKGGPDNGEHELDLARFPKEMIQKLVAFLDEISLPSEEYAAWLAGQGVHTPENSWHRKGQKKCALRGKGWWYNEARKSASEDGIREIVYDDKGKIKNKYGDRLGELQVKVLESGAMSEFYKKYLGDMDFSVALKNMINNNLALYRNQDGSYDEKDKQLLGESVVTHGTLNPDNIVIGRDGQIRIMGGDRSQLYGLRGQQVDWLISACAASPEYQNAFIEAFLDLQKQKNRDLNKEKRGLAMHVMYRAISDGRWFADKGRKDLADNLAKLVCDILQGNGIWKGVDTPLTESV